MCGAKCIGNTEQSLQEQDKVKCKKTQVATIQSL